MTRCAVTGDCQENEWFNPDNGNAEQRTTTGLLVWRKADNWTAFTDGDRTWVNGPHGLQVRGNDQRFGWESDASPLPAGAASPAPAAAGTSITQTAQITNLVQNPVNSTVNTANTIVQRASVTTGGEAVPERPPMNLAPNPSFEFATTPGGATIVGWHSSGAAAWENGHHTAHSGWRSISLAAKPVVNGVFWASSWRSDPIPVEAGATYRLTWWARSEGTFDPTAGDFQLVSWPFDREGHAGSGTGSAAAAALGSAWSQYERRLTPALGTASLQVQFLYVSRRAGDQNKIYIDNLMFSRAP